MDREEREVLEEKMAHLIELLETAISKGEALRDENIILQKKLLDAGQLNAALLNRIDQLCNSYSELYLQKSQQDLETKKLRSILMAVQGIYTQEDLDRWLSRYEDKEPGPFLA